MRSIILGLLSVFIISAEEPAIEINPITHYSFFGCYLNTDNFFQKDGPKTIEEKCPGKFEVLNMQHYPCTKNEQDGAEFILIYRCLND